MKPRTRNVLGGVLAGVLLAAAVLLQLLAPGEVSVDESPSVASYDDPGRRAVFLLLRRLGTDAEAWNLPPSSLPRSGATLVLPHAPVDALWSEELAAGLESPLAESGRGGAATLEVHAPVHYRRFLDAGGVLITFAEPELLEFLEDDLELEAIGEVEVGAPASDDAATRIATGELLDVDWMTSFASPLESAGFSTWAAGEDGEARVVTLSVGDGELVLFAEGDVLSNEALREGDGGLLLVRALEEFDRTGRVLFDEYSLGRWAPISKTELAFSGPFLLLTVHVLALVALFVWRLAWVGRFPRDPEGFEVLSPHLRVRAQAGLVARARRYDLLGRWLVRGVVARAAALWRVRLPRASTHDAGASDDAEPRALLAALGPRAGLDAQAWATRLLGVTPRNAADLDALLSTLIEFEDAATLGREARPRKEGSRHET